MRKIVQSISVLLLVLCLIFGCGKSDESQDVSGSEKKITIAVIPKGATHEHWKSVNVGASKAADELGVELIWKGPIKEDDREEQLQIYETLVARNVNAICIAPIDDMVFVRPVIEAKNVAYPPWFSIRLFRTASTFHSYPPIITGEEYLAQNVSRHY